MFAAIYMPIIEEGQKDRSRWGFENEELAREYMVSCFCEKCKKEWETTHSSDFNRDDYDIHNYPICSCSGEWLIIDEDKLPEKYDLFDLLDAGFAKTEWKR